VNDVPGVQRGNDLAFDVWRQLVHDPGAIVGGPGKL